MKITHLSGAERLDFFKSLFETAQTAGSESAARLERNLLQYLGTDEIDGSSERALTVRNITYELIEGEVNPNIPAPRVDADFYTELREKNARSIERLCTAVAERLPMEEINDVDERNTYIFGASIFYTEWDYLSGGVRVHAVSPLDFYPQPGIFSVEDMEYCFLRFTTTKGELMSKYGVAEERLPLAGSEYEWGGDGLSDTVSVIVAFYRSDEGEVGKFVFSGDLTLSDLPTYYRRKIRVCSVCSSPFGECGCAEGKEVFRDLVDETVRLGENEISVPYYLPKKFPIVIRRNSASFDSYLGSSDCETIRPQQQAINKIESRILGKLLRSGVTPVIPEGSSVSLNNSVFGQVIKMRPGESLDSYGKIDTTPDIEQDIAEADRLYDHAKRILGISDAYLGRETKTVESGYSIQLKIAQSGGRLESKKRLKYHAYSELYRLIFEHYLAFSDEVRPLTYKDSFGRVHESAFSRFDFIETEPSPRYDDGYLFSVDKALGSEYTRESIWQKNLANLTEGTLGDKSSPATLLRYWQTQERAHYPGARENAEYFKDIIENQERENEK